MEAITGGMGSTLVVEGLSFRTLSGAFAVSKRSRGTPSTRNKTLPAARASLGKSLSEVRRGEPRHVLQRSAYRPADTVGAVGAFGRHSPSLPVRRRNTLTTTRFSNSDEHSNVDTLTGKPSKKPADAEPSKQAPAPVSRKVVIVPVPRLKDEAPRTKSKFDRILSKVLDNVVLVALLATWYGSNIFYNIYNKQVLSAFPFPTTCTFVHLLTACSLMSLAWLLRVKKAPKKVNRAMVDQIVPLSCMHLLGFLFTNMSLGAVNVSLTHTIKSLEPFFTVVLSWLFLGSVPSFLTTLTLVPIVAGVVIASATDLSFNWYGFLTAMASNVALQSRNVISKKYMVESSLDSLEIGNNQPLDEINLFASISIGASIMMLPLVLLMDGSSLMLRFQELGAGLVSLDTVGKTIIAGISRTGDVLASYALLSRLNPVTHSVSNCVKRVVVIAVSILFFKTQASHWNIIGTAIALSGVFAYSMAKRVSQDRRPELTAAVEAKRPLAIEQILNLILPGFIKTRLFKNPDPVEDMRAKSFSSSDDGEDQPEYTL
uniref:Sugar phosphate transporter domain-containing protein n=1 Tax=Pyramimonas obovata TaxID=1411642 RepID=A0A7S0N4D7_9CHLO|mmetsp:Transcript_17893/g.39049  ORF Transcript_17893/g.39049 Transcript_17893/m.39049 type:complete len:542 (+) Transcript_17893:169-1794(+)